MHRIIKTFVLTVLLLSLSGCMYYLERGLGGGGLGHYSEGWKKRGASLNDVQQAMTECGFTDFNSGYTEDNSNEGEARAEECLYAKGFENTRWGGLCSMPLYMAQLNTCKNSPARPQRDYSAEWEKSWTSHNEVLQAMKACGYTRFSLGYGEDTSTNAFAAREECMFARGFNYTNHWGGLCSMPDYMIKLAACRNAPPRPQRDYSTAWEKPWLSHNEVLQAMKECGYTRFTLGYGDDTSANAFAAREECMFARGFTYGRKWTGLCSEPEYRRSLPACKDAPLRPWHA